MLYLQIASPKSSVLNFLDSNSFEVIISIFQRTEKVPDMERLRNTGNYCIIVNPHLSINEGWGFLFTEHLLGKRKRSIASTFFA